MPDGPGSDRINSIVIVVTFVVAEMENLSCIMHERRASCE